MTLLSAWVVSGAQPKRGEGVWVPPGKEERKCQKKRDEKGRKNKSRQETWWCT